MTLSNPRKILAVAGAFACLFSTEARLAGQNFDTTPAWDGVSNIGFFGSASAQPAANTPTFGETFVAPSGSTVLNSFTFYVGSTDGATITDPTNPEFGSFLPDGVGDQYTVQGEVFNWTGSLLTGNPDQGTTGPALFTSPTLTITSDGAFDAVTVNIAGGLALTAGDDYVIDLTDLTQPNNADWGIFGTLPSFAHDAPADGGGGFNFSNVGQNGVWDDNTGGDLGELAFKASFSNPVVTPPGVPDSGSTAILFGLGLAGLAIVSRRQRAAAQV
jgi:hypothetical protein